ncbi:RNA polymerase recycling motor HelD [Brevibacillus centrosporus]|uniref:DNA helicase-2 / ATP-dependent DNA helicase PcrA n=1 Tax=Brevibacillus centrosporus TaxID=54910 RepID=A0A1I3M375_9BACL|nr:RNA polymerase recycling motor HelD [Brevibacillus centrosporus]MEC2131281.1 RNA polymerase recycling motor HelD [Brevibacillus centrosporus]MED4906809.1 RNA polymerase recycling motor HelD [Brevibacillus centrosporus]RNB72683.1 helicase [Brevibacillus centrosporus]SFI91499.1 DNA helicase-2 / ATP-dependent DNA helicase PcrA [Brevibacillus centrosporus]GED33653.1 DNA helicase [Brevibacillus centrosporus]
MNEADQDRQKEQQRVVQVISEINRQIDSLQEHVTEVSADIVGIRKHFWDDVTVNFEDASEAAETYASIKQQAEVLSERERVHRHAIQQLRTLRRLVQSPYFGRIDFREETDSASEPVYLGIASLLDKNEEQFLVYDWRAPISSLYYDYAPGPATYETPSGTVTGEITCKRQYVIRDGKLLHLFDTGVTIGDELLQEVLGKQADSQMKSIVATIQRDQNRIIRNDKSRLVIVSGAAGSGKTSAALQRIAYLLYRYRKTLRAEQIVLFSPNSLFNSYVSTVLPELGEENMQQTTFQEYAEHRLGSIFQLEHPLTQMEYVLTAMEEPGYPERIAGIRMKTSPRFMQVIDDYATALKESGILFRPLKFRDRTLISANRISDHFYSLDPSISIPNRMTLVARWLLGELKKHERVERSKPWVEDELELLDKDAFAAVYQELRRKNQFREDTFNDFDREQELLAAKIVKKQFQPLRTWVRELQFIDSTATYRQLFTDSPLTMSIFGADERPSQWSEICAQTLARLDQNELTYEDTPPFLYLQEKLEGFQTNNIVRHVFIDEAQDYSPFQFALLQRLFPRAKMTVLGDWNQAIYAHAYESSSFEAVASLYEPEQTETFVLTKSYRSTEPIVTFTRQLVKDGDRIEPFQRAGRKPSVTVVQDREALAEQIVGRIAELKAEGHQAIAVITKTAQEAQEAYETLRDKLDIRMIGTRAISYETEVLIIPSYLAKGVEFDAVLIYDASAERYSRESERKLFYTACTRAMHELHLYSIGKVSPFLDSVSADSYDFLSS